MSRKTKVNQNVRKQIVEFDQLRHEIYGDQVRKRSEFQIRRCKARIRILMKEMNPGLSVA